MPSSTRALNSRTNADLPVVGVPAPGDTSVLEMSTLQDETLAANADLPVVGVPAPGDTSVLKMSTLQDETLAANSRVGENPPVVDGSAANAGGYNTGGNDQDPPVVDGGNNSEDPSEVAEGENGGNNPEGEDLLVGGGGANGGPPPVVDGGANGGNNPEDASEVAEGENGGSNPEGEDLLVGGGGANGGPPPVVDGGANGGNNPEDPSEVDGGANGGNNPEGGPPPVVDGGANGGNNPEGGDPLIQIANDEVASWLLRLWKEELEVAERLFDRQRISQVKADANLYQVIGMYLVFQGVIISAVSSQSNANKHCNHRPIIWALCVIALVFTIFSSTAFLAVRLLAMEKMKRTDVSKKALSSLIETFKEKGLPFMNTFRDHLLNFDPAPEQPDQTSPSSRFITYIQPVFVNWIFSYAGIVFVAIFAFALTTMIAVWKFLPCDK